MDNDSLYSAAVVSTQCMVMFEEFWDTYPFVTDLTIRVPPVLAQELGRLDNLAREVRGILAMKKRQKIGIGREAGISLH